MAVFQVLENGKEISRFQIDGNQVTGTVPEYLQELVNATWHDSTTEEYMLYTCNGMGNKLSLAEDGSGFICIER
ncbi:hypothetical protein H6F88_17615 [Oculatella sp. FACHB-28]|uniref:hypothetical protein n=1 Tax=Oculatella sp. FACHB-28 TaxID=2692845 RepID=UPI00168654B5|nr:hypothetical protein [Oculatella sp. FACHB-28]MBD2057815.1 hypothetical protein [Oculatella sp. FACHB-28]